MAKRRGRKPAKQPASNVNNSHEDGVPPIKEEEEAFNDHEGIKLNYTIYRMLYSFYEFNSMFKCPKSGKEEQNHYLDN